MFDCRKFINGGLDVNRRLSLQLFIDCSDYLASRGKTFSLLSLEEATRENKFNSKQETSVDKLGEHKLSTVMLSSSTSSAASKENVRCFLSFRKEFRRTRPECNKLESS